MRRRILVLGAGRSSPALIRYLLENPENPPAEIIVGDQSLQSAQNAVGNHPHGMAVVFDLNSTAEVERLISAADVVISMLPPAFHIAVALHCLRLNKHLITASYVSPEMQEMHDKAVSSRLIFLNECGLDPGIDHMSALRELNLLRARGAKILGFESFAGGLITPESSLDNPWGYKFTWNPRNVVMAGQPGPAEYLKEGRKIQIPYERLFTETRKLIIEPYGEMEAYANRDSASYAGLYGLHGIKNMLRGTLRFKGFCRAWQVFVRLGCCVDDKTITFSSRATHRDFIAYFIPPQNQSPLEIQLSRYLRLDIHGHEMQCLKWSGFFDEEPIGMVEGTPAQLLEHILMKKWKLHSGDKDLVLMWHRLTYTLEEEKWETTLHMAVEGKENGLTAMAQTVGLPLGIAARLILKGAIRTKGVQIPVAEELYSPILHELSKEGITFKTETQRIAD